MWVGNEYQFTPHGLLGQNPPVLNPPVLPMPVVDAPQSLLPTAPQNPQVFGGQNDGGGGTGAPDTASGEMDISTGEALGLGGTALGFAGTLTGSTPLGALGFGVSSLGDYSTASDYGYNPTGFGDIIGGLLGNTIIGRALGTRNFTDRALDRLGSKQTDAAAKAKHDVKSRRDFRDSIGGKPGGPSGPPGSPGNQGNGPGGSAPGGGGGNFGGAPGDRNREGGFR